MKEDIKVGDTYEGTGGLRVRIRVESIDVVSGKAVVTLLRSMSRKTMTLAQIRKAYSLTSRAAES